MVGISALIAMRAAEGIAGHFAKNKQIDKNNSDLQDEKLQMIDLLNEEKSKSLNDSIFQKLNSGMANSAQINLLNTIDSDYNKKIDRVHKKYEAMMGEKKSLLKDFIASQGMGITKDTIKGLGK